MADQVTKPAAPPEAVKPVQPEGSDPAENKPEPQQADSDIYAKELERLELENQKKDEIIEHKNRALEATKKKLAKIAADGADDDAGDGTTPVPPTDIAETVRVEIARIKEELRNEVIGVAQADRLENALASLSESERKLVRYHLDNTIRRTGSLEEDVRRARLLANEKALSESDDDVRAKILASFAAGTPRSAPARDAGVSVNPESANILKKILGADAEKAMKHLKKYS